MRALSPLLLGATFMVAILASQKAQAASLLWFQDFNAGGAFASYVDTSQTTSNRFTYATGYSAFNTSNQDFRVTSPTGSYVTTYGLDFGEKAGYLQFDFAPISSTVAGQIVPIAFGDYSGGGATPWGSSSIQILNTATMSWGIRNTQQGLNSAQTFTGSQKVTYVINNTGSAFSYDMGGGIAGQLADGYFRIYVGGTAMTFNGVSAIAAGNIDAALGGFRIGGGNPAGGTIALDNIAFGTLNAIPEPSTYALILMGGAGALLAFRRKKASAL